MFDKKRDQNREQSGFDKKAVEIRRVAKVTSGGKRMRFSAMVVCGDKKGSVGVGVGRGADTRSAVEKGSKRAEKSMKKIQVIGDTIPHEVDYKYGAARVILRPARPGTGVIAGSSARIVLELAGIENVYAKQIGSSDLYANTYCVYEALLSLRNARVLERMDKMRARISLKEQMDADKLKKEIKKRNLRRKEHHDEKGKFGPRRNSKYDNSRRPVKVDVKVAQSSAQVEPAKVEAVKEEVKA